MLTRRQTLVFLAATPAAAALSAPAVAATAQIYAQGGIALNGTDPVAYFTQGAPVAGSSAHTASWRGATWRYGGYCAWAVAQGYTAPTIPEAWTLHNGKLYLNANRRIRRRWEQDIPGYILKADANWPGVLA
jgi:hypothetical protein